VAIHFIQKDRGGTIWHDVIDAAPYRWDSTCTPVVAVYTPGGTQMLATTTADVGPLATIDAACAAGGITIHIGTVPTSLASGDQYLVRKASSGQWEWVTIDGVGSGYVTVRDTLQYTYGTGDTIASPRLSYTVAATVCDEVYANARAEWTYEVDGISRTDTSLFHVSIWAPRLTVTEQDILRRNPRARDMLGSRQRLSDLIEDVWHRDILEELSVVVDPGQLVSGDALHLAVLYRVLAEIATMAEDYEERDRLMESHRAAWERVLQQTPIDSDDDGDISDEDIVRSASTGRVYRV
jgi:hypothetical protein